MAQKPTVGDEVYDHDGGVYGHVDEVRGTMGGDNVVKIGDDILFVFHEAERWKAGVLVEDWVNEHRPAMYEETVTELANETVHKLRTMLEDHTILKFPGLTEKEVGNLVTAVYLAIKGTIPEFAVTFQP